MQKVIELNCEETKVVVGGAKEMQIMKREQSPLERLIWTIVRDVENAFGGGRQAERAKMS
jgi:hypothetical protein